MAEHHGTTRDPVRRGIVAISFGARDAMEAAVLAPRGYGRLGLLIPGRRLTRADLEVVRATPRTPLRVSILAGSYDLSNVDTARGLRQALLDRGHHVDYLEVPEGHSPRTWLHHLGAVLADLFPPGLTVVPPARPPAASGGEGVPDRALRERAEAIDRRSASCAPTNSCCSRTCAPAGPTICSSGTAGAAGGSSSLGQIEQLMQQVGIR
jgi:hypothetical protein